MPKLHSEPPPPCPKLAPPAASIGHNNELSSDFFRMHGPVVFRSCHVFGDSRRSRRKRVPYMFRKGCAGFGAYFRRDRRTVQGLTWIFGVFQKAGARFQKKIIKKKRHSHSQRNVQSRPTTVRHRILWRFSPRGVQERLVFIRPRCRCIGIGIGTRHDMFLQSSCVLRCFVLPWT